MFTGIIEELGKVESVAPYEGGARVRIPATGVVDGTSEGDSIRVNRVCLTALEVRADGFSPDLPKKTFTVQLRNL